MISFMIWNLSLYQITLLWVNFLRVCMKTLEKNLLRVNFIMGKLFMRCYTISNEKLILDQLYSLKRNSKKLSNSN